MAALNPKDMERFGKFLGLLGSNHDGERAAAARKATEFLEDRKLGWPDIAGMLKAPPVIVRPQVVNPAPAEPSRSHQVDARRCLQSGIVWKPHELDFLRDMAARRSRPTEKQQAWLDALGDRVTRHKRAEPEVDY